MNRHARALMWRYTDRPMVQLYACAVAMGLLVALPFVAWAFH